MMMNMTMDWVSDPCQTGCDIEDDNINESTRRVARPSNRKAAMSEWELRQCKYTIVPHSAPFMHRLNQHQMRGKRGEQCRSLNLRHFQEFLLYVN